MTAVGAVTSGPPSGGQAVLMLGVMVVFAIACAGAFAYTYSRHRVFTKGLRGTAVVIDVQPTFLMQRRSVIERPTERVTVATAAWPRGHAVDQKLPAGQYWVGQVVPVVQAPGRPERIFLDRPDLERSTFGVYVPLGMLVMIPVIVYAAFTSPS